jgi:acetyltransferase-like isoleucine patch superfamily enzyme
MLFSKYLFYNLRQFEIERVLFYWYSSKKLLITPNPIHIKNNTWIGAGATILPGVTIGENAIITAGAVVNKEGPANTIVGGIPAKMIKEI